MEDKENKYVGKFLEAEYEQFQTTFLNLLQDYKKKTQRLDKIIELSDKQQFRMLQMNEELEEYKKKLEDRIQADKIVFQKAKEAQMGEMISMIAHQWRQPLATISGAIIGMQLEQLDGNIDCSDPSKVKKVFEKQNEKIEKINEQIKLLSTTIDNFRDFFKPTKHKEYVFLDALIAQAVSIMGAELESENVVIKQEVISGLSVEVHKNEVLQVLVNMLKNSKEAFVREGKKSRKVTLGLKEDEKEIIIFVLDNAGGVKEENLEKIFDPYFSTKDEKNGTGVGLYMAKMIIQEHNNGKIRVKNQDDGVKFEIVWNKEETKG